MSTLLNIVWLVFAGFWLALGYVAAGVICCLPIVTIPAAARKLGRQGFRAAVALRTHAIPIHHSDYTVMKSPLEDFLTVMGSPDAPPTSLVVTTPGEEIPLPGWR